MINNYKQIKFNVKINNILNWCVAYVTEYHLSKIVSFSVIPLLPYYAQLPHVTFDNKNQTSICQIKCKFVPLILESIRSENFSNIGIPRIGIPQFVIQPIDVCDSLCRYTNIV